MLTKLNIRGVLLPRVKRYLSTTACIQQDQSHKTPRKIRIKQEENREIEQPVRSRQRDIGSGNNHRFYRMPDQEQKSESGEKRMPYQLKVILAIFFNPLSLVFYIMVYEAGPKELLDAILEEYSDWKDKK